MDIEYAKKILEETKENYNLISEDFSRTRNKFWEEMSFISDYAKDGDRVLDLGCGNGRLSELFSEKKIEYYGVDFSEGLINIARKRYPKLNFQVADALNLPFPDGFFDKVFSVAVFHHIPSAELRIKFLKEASRALKPGGTLILSVWSFSLPKEIRLFVKYFFLKFFKREDVDFRDAFVPWGNKLLRYVHSFSKKELTLLFLEVGFKIVESRAVKRLKSKEKNLLIIAE
jgi:ubiquinone/menaquinone biosynthesis C-methylase UbiE